VSLLQLAEAATSYEPLKPGEELLVTDRYILFLGSGPHPTVNSAERLRFTPESVAETVDEVRGLVRARGGHGLTWKVTSLVTPPDLADRLLALGARPAGEPMALAMALSEPPAPPPPGIVVSRVETVDDFRAFVSITHEAFEITDRLPEELARIGREGERDLADTRYVRYLARIDGHPVAAGAATFTESGAILHAGSTKPEARGRGAYRALVAARWDEAGRRGTPALVTWAGSMSCPILQRLGFEAVGAMRSLRDEF
jgi:GNAT superfamily N-acetyltransferase